MRALGYLSLAGLLLVGKAWAEPTWARQDPLTRGAAVVSLAGAQLRLAPAQAFDADPFLLEARQAPPWSLPAFGRALPNPWFYPGFAPQLTLRLPPLWGLQPQITSQPFGLGAGAPRLNSELALAYAVGRFRAGLQLNLWRDVRGLALDSVTFARYVTPTFHIGLQDRAVWPLDLARSPTHALSVSAGVRRAPNAPALRLSSTVSQRAPSPSVASALSAAF